MDSIPLRFFNLDCATEYRPVIIRCPLLDINTKSNEQYWRCFSDRHQLKGSVMNRSVTGVSLALVAVLSLGACSQQPADNGPDYADDEAMELIADGLENRSDVIDQQIENGESTGTNKAYEEAVNAELEIIEPLRNRQFESSQLQEDVLSYINVLNESLDVIGNYPTSDMNFLTKWTEVYDERTSMLKEFVDNYDLELDSEYQSVLDELVANGAAAIQRSAIDEKVTALEDSIVFEKTDQGYGYFEYTATAENTTDINFGNVSLVLSLYDEEGVKAGETYVSTNSWAAGEKVRFETTSDINAAQVKVTIDYYEADSAE